MRASVTPSREPRAGLHVDLDRWALDTDGQARVWFELAAAGQPAVA